MKIKVWLVRDTAISVQFGGLERVWVYFTKPKYVVQKLSEKDRDLPWGWIDESEGMYSKLGWMEWDGKMWVKPISLGQWLGYDNDISKYVWGELKNHFLNKPFDDWHELEKSGEVKVEDFCLELELEINLAI
jgi:hypothetical protein